MKLEAILQAAEQAGASVNMRSLWPPTLKRSIDFTPEQLVRFVEGIEAGVRKKAALERLEHWGESCFDTPEHRAEQNAKNKNCRAALDAAIALRPLTACNTCDGTGVVKNLHDWAKGGKREQKCWNCHTPSPDTTTPQPAQGADAEDTLHWHALNYRTADTASAHEMWETLERFVEQKMWVIKRLTPEQSMTRWLSYDKASHVLTIYGKRYAAEMFGEAGFGAMAGTTLRIEAGPEGVVTATRADGVNAELLAVLKHCRDRFFPADQPERDRDFAWYLVNGAIDKASAPAQPVIQRLPADDTEGGGV